MMVTLGLVTMLMTGCAGLDAHQQSMFTGGAMGAGAGAAIDTISGGSAAAGAAIAGVAGVDKNTTGIKTVFLNGFNKLMG